MTDEGVLVALIRRGRELDAAIKGHQEELAGIKRKIAEVIPAGSNLKVDGVTCVVRGPKRSFSAELAAQLLPMDVRLTCVESVVSNTKLREAVEERGLLDQAMIAGVGNPEVRLG